MNRDGQSSTKYKRPCISENIFLQVALFFFFPLFKSKTRQKTTNIGFTPADCPGGDHTASAYRCYMNVPSFQTTLSESQVTTLSTVSGSPWPCMGALASAGRLPPLQPLTSEGMQEAFCTLAAVSPAIKHSCSIPPEKPPCSNLPTGSRRWMFKGEHPMVKVLLAPQYSGP